MDPTVAALTIYPAAWAALFHGLAEGIAVGLAAAASIAVIVTAVVGSLGGRARVEEAVDGLAEAVAVRAPQHLNDLGAILVIERQTAPAAHHRPRRRCQRVASCGSID
jgi:hypothetical protein